MREKVGFRCKTILFISYSCHLSLDRIHSDTIPGLQRLPHRAVQILLCGWLAISPLNTSGWVAEMGHWINTAPISFHECFKTHHVDNADIASVASTSALSTFGLILKCRKGERVSGDMPRSLLQQLLQSRFPHQKINGLLEYESKMEPCQFFRKNRKCTCSYLRLDFGMVYIYRYIYRDGMAYVWKLVRLIRHQLYVQIRRCEVRIFDFWSELLSPQFECYWVMGWGIMEFLNHVPWLLSFCHSCCHSLLCFAAAPRLENSCHSCKSNGMSFRTS